MVIQKQNLAILKWNNSDLRLTKKYQLFQKYKLFPKYKFIYYVDSQHRHLLLQQ